MMLRYVYLTLAVLGTILPMSQFIPASIEGSFSIGALWADSTDTQLVTGLTYDLMVAAVTGLLFIVVDAVRNKIKLAWISVVGTFLIGFSFGLPFYLFLREVKLRPNVPAGQVSQG
jgi:hypothetical protein